MSGIVVVGAGVVGASVAYALTKLGARVTVLEREHPAAGTTSNSFAWANANEKLPRDYFALNFAGVREHHQLSSELGGGWFQSTGNLEIASTPERRSNLRQKVERLRAWGYQARLVDVAEVTDLAPDLTPPSAGSADCAFFPEERWIAGPLLVAQLLQAVRRAGGSVLFPRQVTALDVEGSRVRGVIADGERIPAEVVVDCGGPGAGQLLEARGRRVRKLRSPGLLAITNDVATTLNLVVHFDDLYFRPDGAGRLRLGAGDVDERLPADGKIASDSPLATEILRRAVRSLPALESARVEAIRLGWRPMPADGLSAVGPITGLAGYYLVLTHSGITLGPILGKLIADELTMGRQRPELAPFRPDRLVEKR